MLELLDIEQNNEEKRDKLYKCIQNFNRNY